MTPREPSATEPLDDNDAAVLARLRAAHDRRDPPPAGLSDWITLALSLEDIDVQMVRLTSELSELSVRDGGSSASTITFESHDLTVMLRLEEAADHHLRVDGWVAPAAAHDVELRTGSTTLTTSSDEHGRFSLDRVPHGLALLLLLPTGDDRPGGRATITQAVVL